MEVRIKALAKGICSSIPVVRRLTVRGSAGSYSSRYCYSVWMRHFHFLRQCGLRDYPRAIAELGPGDSLGVGLAALIGGAEQYFGLDVVPFVQTKRNLAVFDELVELFQSQAKIPGPDEFPQTRPRMERYDFPSDILTPAHLAKALAPDRIRNLREELANLTTGSSRGAIRYAAPWSDPNFVQKQAVDLVISQAVMEHVVDLDQTYRAMRDWLKPGALMSHQIDFRSHWTAKSWNGHWTIGDFYWRLLVGGRPFLLNRACHSEHLALMRKYGFRVLLDQPTIEASSLTREQLAPQFRHYSDTDLTTSGAFIVAANERSISS